MKKVLIILTSIIFLAQNLNAQNNQNNFPYENKKDRFSFAQLYLSLDIWNASLEFPYIDSNNFKKRANRNIQGLGLTIGGFHYWGLFDFYVGFPFIKNEHEPIDFKFTPSIETGFKYHPLTIQNNKFSPYLGLAFSFLAYQQDNKNKKRLLTFPVTAGVVFSHNPFSFELGTRYIQNSNFEYYIEKNNKASVSLNQPSYFLSIKWVDDVSLQGRDKIQTDLEKGFYYYLGIGPSASWLTNNDPYISENHPSFNPHNNPTSFPEFSLGLLWKWQNQLGYRTIFNISHRPQKLIKAGFNEKHTYNNNSTAFELLQSFWDYEGFVPFLGISHSYNKLHFERQAQQDPLFISETKEFTGIVFGWDIIPRHRTEWYLRTTLRYYPEIALNLNNEDRVLFPNFEFNFIQFIYQI